MKQCESQVQLAQNQSKKAQLVIDEVKNAPENRNMFRSLGRMFVLQSKADLSLDLATDMERISAAAKVNVENISTLTGKKDVLIKQLNDLSPDGK